MTQAQKRVVVTVLIIMVFLGVGLFVPFASIMNPPDTEAVARAWAGEPQAVSEMPFLQGFRSDSKWIWTMRRIAQTGEHILFSLVVNHNTSDHLALALEDWGRKHPECVQDDFAERMSNSRPAERMPDDSLDVYQALIVVRCPNVPPFNGKPRTAPLP